MIIGGHSSAGIASRAALEAVMLKFPGAEVITAEEAQERDLQFSSASNITTYKIQPIHPDVFYRAPLTRREKRAAKRKADKAKKHLFNNNHKS
jgi:hypothetical protein